MDIFFTYAYLLLFSLLLSYFDIKSFSYPFFLWFLGTSLLLPFYRINSLFVFLIMIALLCNIINLSIGAGDFLYLATLSLVYTLEDILWIVQIASLLGLFMSFFCQTKRLPFLPFLTIGLFIIMNN